MAGQVEQVVEVLAATPLSVLLDQPIQAVVAAAVAAQLVILQVVTAALAS